MRGIDKPDYWNQEWYRQKKSEGFNDQELADQLFIHINTFYRWKRQLEIPKFAYSFSNAKGRNEKMENQTHLNAVGEITELIYRATHNEEE